MKNQHDATLSAHAKITSAHPEVRDWAGLQEALDELYVHAKQQAVFDHTLAVFSLQLSQAIEEGHGPEKVAERLDISVEELAERVLHPESLTMTEVRLLGAAADVEISYTVLTGVKTHD